MIGRLFWLCVAALVYPYAGYPLAVALLARLRRRSPSYRTATPSVTMIIAAYNEEDVIAAKVENTLALDYPRERLQVIVAADGSTDRTCEIVRGFSDRAVDVTCGSIRRGKMGAIERAVHKARGELIVISDANNVYDRGALRELVTLFGDPAVAAVGGAKVIVRGDGPLGDAEGLYQRLESFVKEQETRLGCCVALVGEILAIRREVFETPPAGVINEDNYLAMRLIARGYRLAYAPRARSYERVSPTARDERVRRARMFAGRFQLLALARGNLPWRRPLVLWQLASHHFLRPLSGPALLAALILNALALVRPADDGRHALGRLAPPWNGIVLLSQIAFYLLAALSSRYKPCGTAGKVLYLPTYLVNTGLASLIGLLRFATGRQSHLWDRVDRRPESPAPG